MSKRVATLGQYVRLQTSQIVPAAFPNESFDHYSIPAFDETGGALPAIGATIESGKFLLSGRAVLVSKLNPRKMRVQVFSGRSANRAVASTEFMVYEPREDIDISIGFLARLLNGQDFARRLQSTATGTTNSHVRARPKETLSWPVHIPPLAEQRRIAEILDTIDDTIQITRLVIAKRRALRAGLTSDLLKPPNVASPEESNGIMPLPTSNSTSRNSDIAEGRRLSDYADLNPESLGPATPGDLRFDYFDLSSVSDGSVIKSKVKTVTFGTAPSRARRVACKDDFLFGTVRPLQKSHAWAPSACIASTGFAVVRAKRGLASPRFIGHFLLSEESTLRSDQFAVGSGYPALSEKDLGEFVLPDLALGEQRRIAEILDTVDSTIRQNEAELAKLSELQEGLAADLLSGRVRTVPA